MTYVCGEQMVMRRWLRKQCADSGFTLLAWLSHCVRQFVWADVRLKAEKIAQLCVNQYCCRFSSVQCGCHIVAVHGTQFALLKRYICNRELCILDTAAGLSIFCGTSSQNLGVMDVNYVTGINPGTAKLVVRKAEP